ncbi:MAG TPA: hypothetical protein VFV81_10155 [Verrucomicrobiae bacterium]|nr:hypothetical protein [Verrucomicrobiae bacterium]
MKTKLPAMFVIAASLVGAPGIADSGAAETNSTPRIGVYDSRAVAYAWFWNDKNQKELNGLMQSARAAKAAGDTNRFASLSGQLRRHQEQMHREVFSTAPAAEAIADLKVRLPDIQKGAGVTALVSKWDADGLAKYPGAETVDVTDTLVHEFIVPTDEQQKVLAEMVKVKPLPIEECNELIRKGEI